MESKYIKTGDYELPNLPLKAHEKALYTTLLMKDELTNHLISVSKDAETLLNKLMKSYKKRDEKLSERNKEINQLEWVKLMNNY